MEFNDWRGYDTQKVIIPNGTTEIICFEFLGAKVKEVVLPESIKSIDEYAFAGCENLERINLPKSLEKIGECAFKGCKSLHKFDMPVYNDCDYVLCCDNSFEGCPASKTLNADVFIPLTAK